MEQIPNIRVMTEEQRREGIPVLERWLHATGDFITKSRVHAVNVHDRELYEKMKAAFYAYNRWLSK